LPVPVTSVGHPPGSSGTGRKSLAPRWEIAVDNRIGGPAAALPCPLLGYAPSSPRAADRGLRHEGGIQARDRTGQPFTQVHPRRVPEVLPAPGKVGERIAYVSIPGRRVAGVDARAGQFPDDRPERVEADAFAASHVEDHSRRDRGPARKQVRLYGVLDVREIAGLLPVSEDRGSLACKGSGDELRDRGAVGRMRVL